MNENKTDKLTQFLQENAPQAPAAPADLETRIADRLKNQRPMPFAAALATAAVLTLGVIVSLTGKQRSSGEDNAAIFAREALVEAALGLEAAEQAENSEEISEDLFGEWLSLAATVAQN